MRELEGKYESPEPYELLVRPVPELPDEPLDGPRAGAVVTPPVDTPDPPDEEPEDPVEPPVVEPEPLPEELPEPPPAGGAPPEGCAFADCGSMARNAAPSARAFLIHEVMVTPSERDERHRSTGSLFSDDARTLSKHLRRLFVWQSEQV